MKIGEFWIEKEVDEDEIEEAIELVAYDGNDTWTVILGVIEDGLFFEDVDENFCEWRTVMSGQYIYDNYYRYSEAYRL